MKPAVNHTDLLISVKKPHKWHGMEDLYCYTAVAKLLVGEEVGANTITAKAGDLEDTITLNGLADDDDSDEIEIIEGYYSIEDPFAELAANEECVKCVKGWFMAMGNLTMASMVGAIAGMMGDHKITMLSSMMEGTTQKDFAKLNRMLNKIKK